MLRRLIKKIGVLVLIGVTLSYSFNTEALLYVFTNVKESFHNTNIVDKIYLAKKNKNVVDSFLVNTSRLHAAINPAEKEYMLDIGPVNGSVTANYVYVAFFNPVGSGRSASIKRIAVRANTASSTASNYVNLSVRRISSSTGGTQIASTSYIYKNASTSDSIMEVRTAGPTVTLSGTTDSRILGQPLSGAVGSYYSRRDITFDSSEETLVLQPGEGVAVYQEAAGTAAAAVRVFIEWDETVNPPPSQNEFLFAFPRVENAAAANYVYNSFFNPSGSGKTAVVKRIWFGSETCDAGAVYTNNIVLKRISAASAGTAVASSSIPKKNTSGATTSMEFRYTNVTVTQVGGTDARLGHVTPCGAAGQATGWQEIDFDHHDEQLILQPGEGIALISEAAGNANQLTRMIIEWGEVTTGSTPSSQGEYIWASDKVAAATAANTSLYTFFNPVGSGKTAIIKRLVIRANATTTSAYTSLQFRRIIAASAGTLVASSSYPKKHTGSATSSMEIRWCLQACTSAITATYAGDANAKIISVTGAGAVGQVIGQQEIVFGDNEKLVIKEGEGIGLYNDVLTSSAALSVKILIEWDEEASAPTAQNQYVMSIGPINGNTGASYNYVTFFNPSGSGKTAIIKRIRIRVDTVAAAVYIPIQLRRLSAASAGTLVASSSYPKKNTGSATSSMEIRHTGVTATFSGTTDSKMIAIQTPGAVASAAAGNTGYAEVLFSNNEDVVLQPGEGVGLYQDAAGDADLRVRLLIEWEEAASAPSSLGQYLYTSGPINQSTSLGYVYSTFFNPTGSGKNFIIKKLMTKVNRSVAATVPAYTPFSLRKISSHSGGTSVASTSIPKKHSNTATTTAEIRTTGVTVSLMQSTSSRLVSGTTPGVVNQPFGDQEDSIYYGDELVLKSGEGIALYNEQATGDANVRYRFLVEWDEESNGIIPQVLTFTISTSSVYFGNASPVASRYASSTSLLGSDVETEAHTLSVITNATNGYTISVRGATLTSGSTTINAIGNTNTASATNTEQFGIRLTATGGSGTVSTPYSASGFAYSATATTSSSIASATVGDNATTTFSVRYLLNIAATTPPSVFSTSVVYVATANF